MMKSLTSLSSNITMQDPWIHQASMNISFVHGRSINPERLWRIWGYQLSFYHLVGGLEHQFYVSIYWEFHHPNWRTPSFFRGVGIRKPTSHCLEGTPHDFHAPRLINPGFDTMLTSGNPPTSPTDEAMTADQVGATRSGKSWDYSPTWWLIPRLVSGL